MPEVDERVMKFVEDALRKNPRIKLEDLYEKTIKFDRAMGKLSRRQFNARYPLQVKRRRALKAKARGGRKRGGTPSKSRLKRAPSATAGSSKDAVRQVLLQFATDIAAAEERKDLVKVLAGVDKYVDQVLEGVEKA
jgi:hypothetical protein